MVQQPVEDGRGDDRVAKDLAPGAQALIAGQDDRAALIAAGRERGGRSAEREGTRWSGSLTEATPLATFEFENSAI
jgi:hypothetical protein